MALDGNFVLDTNVLMHIKNKDSHINYVHKRTLKPFTSAIDNVDNDHMSQMNNSNILILVYFKTTTN